ncbi:MAG: ADOP family duplicated permease [Terriglobales bacterium]
MRVTTLLRNLLHRRAADRELDQEIGAFADEMNQRTPHSVYAEQVREQVRAARPGAGLESWARDLRYAGRMLRKAPALTLACILTFAVGVGAVTVIFSMVNALVFRRLPVYQPQQLHMLSFTQNGADAGTALTPLDLRTLARTGTRAFSAVTSASIDDIGLSVHGRSRIAFGSFVAGNFFGVMGVRPALGQFFSRDDAPAVVLSYDYWHSRFHANPAVVGSEAVAEGRPVTILGIAPRGFHGIVSVMDTQVFVPVDLAPKGSAGIMPFYGVPVVRLRPGVAPAAARAELATFAHSLAAAHPKLDKNLAIQMWPMGDGMISSQGGSNPFAIISALFLTLAALVLLLAAANIMGVLLARARTREREMALRSALGAGRHRLARQVFLEALVLAFCGGIVGMLLGMAASRTLGASPPNVGLPIVLDFGFDWRVFGFGFAMALVMALVAGILPAWRAASTDPNQTLRGPEAGSSGRRRQRLRSALVAAQVAGSLMLLIVGGLFVRSLAHAQHRPLGFAPSGVWNFEINVSGADYTSAQGKQFYAQFLPAVRALPGVHSASLAMTYPFGFDKSFDTVHAAGKANPSPSSTLNYVSPGYFTTMAIALLQGRAIAATDTAQSPAVAVISARLARSLWPGQNPLGRRIVLGSGSKDSATVIGVAGNAALSFSGPAGPEVYQPLTQNYLPRQVLQVRTAPGATPVPAVEQLLQRIAPQVPVGVVQSMPAAVNGLNGLFLFNLGARLATTMGLLGLFLALIGIYGVVAYSAAQRTHEIGIRMALGAQPRQVLTALLRSAALTVGVGILIGLLAAAAIGKLAGAFLVGVSGLDPLTFIAATVLLAAVAFAASLLPALRAGQANPLEVLKCE